MDDEPVEQKPFVRGRRLASLRASQKIFLLAGNEAAMQQIDNQIEQPTVNRSIQSDEEYSQEVENSSGNDIIDVEEPKKKRRGRPVTIIECKSCKEVKPNRANSYCKKCYSRIYQSKYKQKNLRKCVKCGEIKNHAANGMCINCYNRLIVKPKQKTEAYKQKNLRKCSECKQIKRHEAKGLCKVCYERVVRAPKMRAKNYSAFDLIKCKQCGERRKHAARGLCRKCYNQHSYKKTAKTPKRPKSFPMPTQPIKRERVMSSSDDENERPSTSSQSSSQIPSFNLSSVKIEQQEEDVKPEFNDLK